MDKFKYNVLIVGGIGPDVWDKEEVIEATDIFEAASIMKEKIKGNDGWVVSIEQQD